MPLFIDRGHFLLTSSFAGTGWVPLRRVSLASGSFETLQLVGQSTTLALSADGSAVGMALPNDSGGNFVRLDLSDGSTLKGNTYKYMREVAISRDGTELAFPVWDGVLVYQFAGEFGEPRTLKIESPRHGLGAVYSRVKDVLYVASAEVGGDDASAIEAFNAKTLEWISMLDDGPGLDWVTAAQGAMGIGRMRISRDGKMLGVTVDEGVKIYPLP
jgi:hypothetical protein